MTYVLMGCDICDGKIVGASSIAVSNNYEKITKFLESIIKKNNGEIGTDFSTYEVDVTVNGTVYKHTHMLYIETTKMLEE